MQQGLSLKKIKHNPKNNDSNNEERMKEMDSIRNNMSMQLFTLRGAYGYMGFTEKVGENLYTVDSQGFKETLENSTEPLDASKVSTLSANQLSVLKQSRSASWMIPLLSKMGSLGMMDLREGLVNPEFLQRTQTMKAYQKSI